MRRYEKKSHIERLNKKLNESINQEPQSPSQDEVNREISSFKGGDEQVDETSPEKALGAAKKMWDTQNGGDMYDNPRAKKMLQTYGEKLIGTKLFGNEVNSVQVTLANNKKDNDGVHNVHELMVLITAYNRNSNNTENKGSSIWYNYSTDQYMSGGHVTSLQPFNGEVSRFDARQLYKIAAHFNPNTRYKYFTRELNISIDEVADGERNDFDYIDGDAYHNGDMNEAFLKLCGIKIIK